VSAARCVRYSRAVCMSEPIVAALRPCGHAVACEGCVWRLTLRTDRLPTAARLLNGASCGRQVLERLRHMPSRFDAHVSIRRALASTLGTLLLGGFFRAPTGAEVETEACDMRRSADGRCSHSAQRRRAKRSGSHLWARMFFYPSQSKKNSRWTAARPTPGPWAQHMVRFDGRRRHMPHIFYGTRVPLVAFARGG
jgi:hypothetical protein